MGVADRLEESIQDLSNAQQPLVAQLSDLQHSNQQLEEAFYMVQVRIHHNFPEILSFCRSGAAVEDAKCRKISNPMYCDVTVSVNHYSYSLYSVPKSSNPKPFLRTVSAC